MAALTPTQLTNYISSAQCCLSQKGDTLLDQLRGGKVDRCCMYRHQLAHAALEVLQCTKLDTTTDKEYQYSCLTEAQICDLVDHIDSYCGDCKTYTAKTVT